MQHSAKAKPYKALVDRPYGYYTLDEDELARFKWWVTYDPIHSPYPLTPLAGSICARNWQQGHTGAAEITHLPMSKGTEDRISPEGWGSIAASGMPTTPEEMKERGQLFRERMVPYLERFDEMWGDFRHKGKVGDRLREIQENYARIGTFDPETWSFDSEKFFANLEKMPNIDLYELLFETIRIAARHWVIHFEIMYLISTIYMTFEGLTKELLGFTDTDPRFQRLIQGFDNKIYEFDRELWRLIHLAVNLGLADIFKEVSERELVSRLTETDAGKEWLGEFRQFLKTYGRRSPSPHDVFKVTWFEEPAPVLVMIKDYIATGLIDYDAERRKIVADREKAVAEALEKVPSERKEEFKKLLKAAQIAYCWNEDHDYWIEQLGHSSIRYVILEMGKRLHKAGAIADPNDIFFLNTDEIRATFLIAVHGYYDFREFVDQRKARFEVAPAKVPPRITGEWAREEVKAPQFIKVHGLGPRVAPAEKVDIFGYPGAPGVAEGTARVITDVGEVYRIEPGTILVTTATGPVWTPIFAKLKGVVTDAGGTLTHAAVVAREYGIPAVVGTDDATHRIKDGQTIRVDGNNGYVWIV